MSALPQQSFPLFVLTPETSVNELLRQRPGVIGVLNAFGIDSCCGGAASIATAAADARVPLETLIAALDAATSSAAALHSRPEGAP